MAFVIEQADEEKKKKPDDGFKLSSDSGNIASGASVSNAISLGKARVLGVVIPSNFDGEKISFQVSFDNGATFVSLVDNLGDDHYIDTKAGSFTPVDQAVFASVTLVKILSGVSETPVNVSVDTTFQLVVSY